MKYSVKCERSLEKPDSEVTITNEDKSLCLTHKAAALVGKKWVFGPGVGDTVKGKNIKRWSFGAVIDKALEGKNKAYLQIDYVGTVGGNGCCICMKVYREIKPKKW